MLLYNSDTDLHTIDYSQSAALHRMTTFLKSSCIHRVDGAEGLPADFLILHVILGSVQSASEAVALLVRLLANPCKISLTP